MAVFKYPFKHAGLTAILLAVSLLSPQLLAQSPSEVADVLDMPAMEVRNAAQSLQLGISRADRRLVSVGVRGLVLLSDDDGRSWRQARHVPVSVTLTAVEMVSAERGWAVGHSGVVLFSADGGETWERRMDGNDVAQVVLEGARQLLASGAEGGERALRNAEYMVADGPDKPILDVAFADERRGYLVGAYGLALETRDGGASWQSLVERLPNPRGNHFYQIQIRGQQVLIVGEQGVVLRSTDAGETFTQVSVPYSGTFFGALDLEGAGLLVYGLQGNAWRSMDEGVSWQRVDTGQAVSLAAGLRQRDGTVLLADESGRLLRSTNNARSFVDMDAQTGAGATGLSEAADGGLIVSSMRGMQRLEHDVIGAGARQ